MHEIDFCECKYCSYVQGIQLAQKELVSKQLFPSLAQAVFFQLSTKGYRLLHNFLLLCVIENSHTKQIKVLSLKPLK